MMDLATFTMKQLAETVSRMHRISGKTWAFFDKTLRKENSKPLSLIKKAEYNIVPVGDLIRFAEMCGYRMNFQFERIGMMEAKRKLANIARKTAYALAATVLLVAFYLLISTVDQ